MTDQLGIHKIPGACVLCALHYISKATEERVMQVCLGNNWEAKRGMTTPEWQKSAKELGVSIVRADIKPIRTGRFLKKYQDSRYFVETFDHLFVIDKGIMIDTRNPKPPGLCRVIVAAWEIK